MQVHEQRIGYKPVLPQPFDFSYHVRLLEKPLMHTDVTRLEIWEWSDYTRRERRGQHNTRQARTGIGTESRYRTASVSQSGSSRHTWWPAS